MRKRNGKDYAWCAVKAAIGIAFGAVMLWNQSIETPAAWKPAGEFKLTYYCPCRKCNGKWTGQPTASGAELEPGVTIAVDKKVIPLGTKVRIGEHEFIAQDTGSGIKGHRIDILLDDHEACRQAGVQKSEVYVWEDE